MTTINGTRRLFLQRSRDATLAFLAIHLLGVAFVRAEGRRLEATLVSHARGEELGLLGRVDLMILGGASEREVIWETTRLVATNTQAALAGLVLPGGSGGGPATFLGYRKTASGPAPPHRRRHLVHLWARTSRV